MNYYPFHLGDYAAHTAHLEPMEDLAYRRMIDLYYRTEAPLPRDISAIARLIRMKGHEDAISAVIDEFFDDCTDGWMHARCDEEIQKMQDKQAKARESAKASHSARKANAMRTQSERNVEAEQTHGEPLAPNTNTNTNTKKEVSGSAQAPTPPPPFRGDVDLEALNGRHVVAIAGDWELPAAWGMDAEALGWKPAEVLRESEKFRQFWTVGNGQGKRRSVKGWRQAWSNWLSKAERFAR